MSEPKVLFLDVDGVLNNVNTPTPTRGGKEK
jgi:histidinol phosphatase-like enzyme